LAATGYTVVEKFRVATAKAGCHGEIAPHLRMWENVEAFWLVYFRNFAIKKHQS